jgi:hypothetical protein
MRSSRHTSRSAFLFLATFLLPAALAIDTCTQYPEVKINLRKYERSDGNDNNVGGKQCTQDLYYDPWSDAPNPPITAQTKIPQDGQAKRETGATKKYGDKYTCDHLLELQQVKEIMEQPGGACEKAAEYAAANTAAEAIEKLRKIRWHTWQPANLYFVENALEKRKGNTVSNGAGSLKGLKWHRTNEIYSLVVGGTGAQAVLTAAAIDAEIETQFPGATTGVAAKWAAYTLMITKDWAAKKQKAEDELCKAKSRAAGGGSGGGGGAPKKRAPTLPARMLRRHLSGMGAGFATAPSSSAFPPVGLSSLVERARKGAARSGPHAPPGRCCPAKNQQQKKVIPRQNVKTAPPPATKPRKPAQRPAPRPANTKKQVAKRPASRARRDVGKPRVQKRTTPKQKPRITPKPTRRPRGKPRQRRRRR